METKVWVGRIATFAIFCSVFTLGWCEEDVKCFERDVGIAGRSIVCVCNATHCDTITRENPPPQTYVMYTSTNAGKRLDKSYGPIITDLTPQQFNNRTATKTAVPGITDPDVFDDDEPEFENFRRWESDLPTDITAENVDPRALIAAYRNLFKNSQHQKNDKDSLEDDSLLNLAGFESDIPIDIMTGNVNLRTVITKFRNLYKNSQREDDDLDLLEDGSSCDTAIRNVTLTISSARRQVIQGFGGSVTDASSINWLQLSEETQQQFIDSYFGPKGLEYNLIRVPIAGSDFSEYPYTYNELPWNDHALSNFSLTYHDHIYKLPMIKRAQEVATDEIKITASTWSPPIWMKTNQRITGFGQLKPEFFQTYADYHIRFLEEYEKAGVNIWAITTTNEPLNGIIPVAQFNSLGFAPWQMAKYVGENLGPTIRKSRFNKTLILGVDDQRYMLPIYLRGMVQEDPKSLEYLDGIAVHYYGNFVPAILLSLIHRQFPDKILLSTEACEGAMPWHSERVEIGSWRRARRYATSIMEDLNNYVVGWIDWNLCLSPTGGPNWANNFVDSPILVYGAQDEFIKQPMYYAMGHFSKFIPRGSHVLSVQRTGDLLIESVAVIKPDNNIVIVIQNRRRSPLNMKVYISSTKFIEFEMEPESLKTIEFNP